MSSVIFDETHWLLQTVVLTDFNNSYKVVRPFLFLLSDEDECVAGNPCSHTCHNAMGTYYCSCPKGLTIAADGRTCQGIHKAKSYRHIYTWTGNL
jgi:hypothetical protein